jgi:hypothetical protein
LNRHVPIGWFTLLGDEHDSPEHNKQVRNLAVSVYDLIPSTSEQLELFASPTHAVSEAMDKINGSATQVML